MKRDGIFWILVCQGKTKKDDGKKNLKNPINNKHNCLEENNIVISVGVRLRTLVE